jgi:hypothetical protein
MTNYIAMIKRTAEAYAKLGLRNKKLFWYPLQYKGKYKKYMLNAAAYKILGVFLKFPKAFLRI